MRLNSLVVLAFTEGMLAGVRLQLTQVRDSRCTTACVQLQVYNCKCTTACVPLEVYGCMCTAAADPGTQLQSVHTCRTAGTRVKVHHCMCTTACVQLHLTQVHDPPGRDVLSPPDPLQNLHLLPPRVLSLQRPGHSEATKVRLQK